MKRCDKIPTVWFGRLRARRAAFACTMLLACGLCGCERAEPLQWTAGKPVATLSPELQQQVAEIVQENSGTAEQPRMLSDAAPQKIDSQTPDEFRRLQQLRHGQQVYMKRCVQCHGVSGAGDGPAAAAMYPRPRDYTAGKFKFTSTPYDYKPLRSDLLGTLERGIRGTSMPEFRLLPEQDREDVVDYVILLSQRGELEYQLVAEAKAADELDPDFIPDIVDDVKRRWHEGAVSLTQPITPQPELTQERVALGREAFLSKGCSKCHGDDGRGHTADNIGKDFWGYPTRAADLTSGMLRGGQQPIDVYRRIMNGINGTPMPGFRSSLEAEPETIWNLVSYVLATSNRRRAGEEISAGLLKPFDYGLTPEADSEGDPESDSGSEEAAAEQ